MATISSIGTSSRNYSTIAAWLAAFANGGWEGECYNDSEFLVTASIVFNQATSAANYIKLRPASGQGFKDTANAALFYNQSNGVGIRTTTAYSGALISMTAQFVTLDGLQVYHAATSGATVAISGAATNQTVQNCIAMGLNATGTSAVVLITGAASVIRNSVIVCNSATATSNGLRLASASTAVNNTIVSPNHAGAKAVQAVYGTAVFRNNAFFGFGTAHSGTYDNDGHNATDLSSAPGSTGNLTSQAFSTATFANITNNFRAVSGSCLVNAGVTDATNVPSGTDIFGITRSTWDIGAHELASSGITGSLNATLDDATLAATGQLLIKGAVAATLADLTLSATAALKLQAAVNVTLADATLTATGKAIIKGAVNATLDDATLSSSAKLAIKGSVNVTLEDLTANATASHGGTVGVVDGQLEDATLAATGKLYVKGAVNATLQDATLVATGKLAIKGAVAATLADLTLAAAATTKIKGAVNATLEDLTLSATAKLVVKAAVNVTLENLALVATGEIVLPFAYSETPIYYKFVPSPRNFSFTPQPRNWTITPQPRNWTYTPGED